VIAACQLETLKALTPAFKQASYPPHGDVAAVTDESLACPDDEEDGEGWTELVVVGGAVVDAGLVISPEGCGEAEQG